LAQAQDTFGKLADAHREILAASRLSEAVEITAVQDGETVTMSPNQWVTLTQANRDLYRQGRLLREVALGACDDAARNRRFALGVSIVAALWLVVAAIAVVTR
jgi:hypothetical protein